MLENVVGRRFRSLAAAACIAVAALARAQAPAAPQPPLSLRIVGGLAGVNQYTRHEEPFWTRDFPRLSEGRAVAEIVPFDRAGIRGQEVLRLVQAGAVPFGTALLNLSASLDPELEAPDMAALSPNMSSLRRVVASFRPYLERMLRERYGIELLAVYVYPAQVGFCAKPLSRLADFAGRRLRVSSTSQSDFVSALGATPVQTAFADIVSNVRSGSIECAITGTMSGNTIGLHEATSYIYTMPFSWGLAAFVANGAAWNALPASLQELLRRELPALERAIWAEAERETGEGIACNTGGSSCVGGRKGRMTAVAMSPLDEQLRRDILVRKVLPGWIQRCGARCAQVWKETVGPATGFDAEAR